MLGATFVFAAGALLPRPLPPARAGRDRRQRVTTPLPQEVLHHRLDPVPVPRLLGRRHASSTTGWRRRRPDAMTVYVTAKQWMWKFAYPDGRSSMDVLTVPVGKPVKLVMTSRDVIHSFYVPAFRMKQDVVPGRYYTAWFEANEPGHLRDRLRRVLRREPLADARRGARALHAGDYARWLEGRPPATERPRRAGPRRRGAARMPQLPHPRRSASHRPDLGGPLRIAGARWRAGRTVVADDAYLTRSMMDPQARCRRRLTRA